jgi:hypothetical protein
MNNSKQKLWLAGMVGGDRKILEKYFHFSAKIV